MSTFQSGTIVETQGDSGQLDNELHSSIVVDNMDKKDVEKSSGLLSPVSDSCRKPQSRGSTSEVYKYSSKKPQRKDIPKQPPTRSSPSSSIPLPVKNVPSPKIPLLRGGKSASRSSSLNLRTNQVTNKHTLEVQFINKNKRLTQLKKELLEKQKPVLDLYQNLVQIKKRLEELGKTVNLEELKLIPISEKKPVQADGGGESAPTEMLTSMKDSIEEIPKTLMDICKNLLSRRALIVELLESVTKSEIDVSEVSDKIESLKNEGAQLQHSLDAVIAEHETKINELVHNWQVLLNDKKNANTHGKIEELEAKLKAQEKLTQESNQVIVDLQRKLDDRKFGMDKSVAELNGVITTLREQIRKLEQDLENERKASVEIKSRNNSNSQNLKNMRSKVTELENEKKASDVANVELQKKLRLAQEQVKHKETLWLKEKEELSKSLKHQENLLQKLTAEKNEFETRVANIEEKKTSTVEDLQCTIDSLSRELVEVKEKLEKTEMERDAEATKCKEFESYLSRMGWESKESMNKVSSCIEWGKATARNNQAEHYVQDMAKDLKIRELEDKLAQLEMETINRNEHEKMLMETLCNDPTETAKQLGRQQECISKYQTLLEESERRLKEKSTEVSNLRSEIRQLKVRQEALEEQNYNCPTDDLKRMVEEGRLKLNELMRKALESEQKMERYEEVIEKQSKQMSEMENLLRHRENMSGILKASRDELLLDKESLTRYSQELRAVLAEVTKEGKMKDRLIKELQEKIDLREKQIGKLEKEVGDLETNLRLTNEKRFKLQETIGTMEKELQSTKAHMNQLTDINARTRFKLLKPV